MSEVFVIDPQGEGVAGALARLGVAVRGEVSADTVIGSTPPPGTEAIVLAAPARPIDPALVHACDRSGLRLVVVGEAERAQRAAAGHGLPWAPLSDDWAVLEALGNAPAVARGPGPQRGSIITVWGPSGAPGRSSVASLLATELARGAAPTALVDADVHAPSLALALGVPDEGPGFAAACRQAELGGLDTRELERIAQLLPGPTAHADSELRFLCGLNRPSRWPELGGNRVAAALKLCREWASHTVVDVAASLESDEEIVSDLEGPRRNAATLAAVDAADVVVAVISADPVGLARGVRALAELRALRGARAVHVVVNKLRPGPLGLDPSAQARRALDQLAGIAAPSFLPWEPRALDAALLRARAVAEVAPRSRLVLAVRRMVGEALLPMLGERVPAASVA